MIDSAMEAAAVEAARTTIVVVTRNRANTVLHTLNRLLALEPRPPIIVLDQNSRDDTVPRLHELRQKVSDLRVICMGDDVPSVGYNLGVDLARTEFVALCGEDVCWEPGSLSHAESLFDTYERLGLITAKVLDSSSGGADELTAAMETLPGVPRSQLPGPPVLRLHTGAAIARTRAYVRNSGFDPLLHLAREERLIAYDFAAHGWEVCYVDGVCACRTPPRQPVSSAHTRRLRLRDEVVLAWLRRPLRYSVRAAADLLRRATHDPAALLAVFGAARRLPWALVERERLPGDVERRIRSAERAVGAGQ